MEIGFRTTGSFDRTEKWLTKLLRGDIYEILNRYGRIGVDALAKATPRASGETASSWSYRIVKNRNSASIEWYNTHTNDGQNIAVLIQYGHGTGTGGYVNGIDYINPAMRPIFEDIAANVWKEVTNA